MPRGLIAWTWLFALLWASSVLALAADPLRDALEVGDIAFEALPPARPRDEATAEQALTFVEWLQRRGEFDDAQRWLEALRGYVDGDESLPARTRARLLTLESRQFVHRADPAAARETAEAAVELLEQAGDSTELARAWSQLATALRSGDRRSEALDASGRAVAMHARIAPQSNAALWAMAGRVAIQRSNGEFDAANQTLDQLQALLPPDTPDIELRASVLNLHGVRHLLASELPAAVRALAGSAELLEQAPHARVLKVTVQQNLAMASWDLGDLGLARVQMVGSPGTELEFAL